MLTASATRVAVTITQPLDVPAASAKAAFLDYTWKRGGGIPGLVTNEGPRRTLWPLKLEEALLPDDADGSVRYAVTDNGPVLSVDLLPDTHSATVAFADNGPGCELTWSVAFDVAARAPFWERFTQTTVGAAASSLAAHVATPQLYTRRMRLASPSARAAIDAWLTFTFDSGGGLPLPPPLPLGRDEVAGTRRRMVIPPFMSESVLSVDVDDDGARGEVRYVVDNPGLLTYQVHTHAGRVRFTSVPDGGVEMLWEVEVRPLAGWDGLVRSFTSGIISTLSRNLKVHIAEPGAKVELAGPRGNGPAFGSVPKASWLGGVLAAHLADKRSAAEQTQALFQPWTWGRSDEAGDGEEWTVGSMPP